MFVDTSAFYAVLDAGDRYHDSAREFLLQARSQALKLVSTSYVLTETIALVQRRGGLDPVRAFVSNIVPLLQVYWVEAEVHRAALAILLAAGQRELSLVDCVSFEVMRRFDIKQAFTFDRDFAVHGFECLPQRSARL